MKVIFLHLTDLHCEDRISYLDKKVDSISKIIKKDTFSNNVVVGFTGDLTKKGFSKQYDAVEEFIEKLRRKIESEKEIRFVFCPGNHDRNFEENDETLLFDEIKKIDANNFEEAVQKKKHLNDNYENFVVKHSERRESINSVLDKYSLRFKDGMVSVYSLNNALLTTFDKSKKYEENAGNIYIPNDYIKLQRRNESLNIFISHLPVSWLKNETKNHFDHMANCCLDFAFSGHIHKDNICSNSSGYYEFTSPALGENDDSAFTIFHIDEHKISYAIYSFNAKDNESYFEREINGTNSFEYKKKEATSNGFLVNIDFIDENSNISFGNYEIDSKDIFVFPSLCEKKYMSGDKYHVNNYGEF